MKRRKKQRKPLIKESKRGAGKNPDYDFLFDDDTEDEPLPFDYREKAQQTKSPTPTADKYFNMLEQDKQKRSQQTLVIADRPLSQFERISVGVIFACMVVWTLLISAIVLPLVRSPILAFGFLGMVVVYWLFVWFTYYVMWRFFWIVLALSWLLATIFSIFGLGTIDEMIRLYLAYGRF